MRSAALIFSYVYNARPGKAAFENGLRSFWVFLFILLLRFAGHFPAQHNEACRNGGADEKKMRVRSYTLPPADVLRRIPVFAVQIPVLHGLAHMLCFDAFAARKVRDGAAHLQHPVVSAGGKAHALKGAAQHTVGVRRKAAYAAQHRAGKARIAGDARTFIADVLHSAGCQHALQDRCAALAARISGKVGVFHGRDLYMKVDPILYRSRADIKYPKTCNKMQEIDIELCVYT